MLALAVPAHDRREGEAAPFALAARLRDVRDDPEDPGLQRRAALEASDPADDAEPGFLHDLLCDRAGGDVHPGDAEHPGAVLVDQRREDALVTATERSDDLVLPRWGCVRRLGGVHGGTVRLARSAVQRRPE